MKARKRNHVLQVRAEDSFPRICFNVCFSTTQGLMKPGLAWDSTV
ncbi:rCG25322 [Rattus norvegicus]|uniref:RCG25322 n=1 Tax=Rattus norvegicus TaxID=10116 RepID=A6I481_RAT|nr:rCG25322 [Rattus norvegicus]